MHPCSKLKPHLAKRRALANIEEDDAAIVPGRGHNIELRRTIPRKKNLEDRRKGPRGGGGDREKMDPHLDRIELDRVDGVSPPGERGDGFAAHGGPQFHRVARGCKSVLCRPTRETLVFKALRAEDRDTRRRWWSTPVKKLVPRIVTGATPGANISPERSCSGRGKIPASLVNC
jgi:hypothetical protein